MGKPLQALANLIDESLRLQADEDGFEHWAFVLVVSAPDGEESTHTYNCDPANLPKMLREAAENFERGDTTRRQPGGTKAN